MCFISMFIATALNKLSEYSYRLLHFTKYYSIHFYCLFKIVKSPQCILKVWSYIKLVNHWLTEKYYLGAQILMFWCLVLWNSYLLHTFITRLLNAQRSSKGIYLFTVKLNKMVLTLQQMLSFQQLAHIIACKSSYSSLQQTENSTNLKIYFEEHSHQWMVDF